MPEPANNALDDARKKARRRLVGAILLALIAAVVVPLFLESDPKPLGPDVQIQIPAVDDSKFQNRLTPASKGGDKSIESTKSTVTPPADIKSGESAAVGTTPRIETASPQASPPGSIPAAPDPGAAKSAAGTATTDTPNRSDSKSGSSDTAEASAGARKDGGSSPAVKGGEIAGAASAASAPNSSPPSKSTNGGLEKSVPTTTEPATDRPPAKSPEKTSAKSSPVDKSAPAEKTAGSDKASAKADRADKVAATKVPAPAAEPTHSLGTATLNTSPPPAAKAGEFVVQVGAYLDKTVATEKAARAGEQGYPVYLEPVASKSGAVQRVRVGPFPTREAADAAAAKLAAAGFPTDVRPR